MTLSEGLRDGGNDGLGGGAKGGGSFVGKGDDCIILERDFSCNVSSTSSFAVGTISDKNSRSSEDRAREFRELCDTVGFVLEKRLRNRETADAGGLASGRLSASEFCMGNEDVEVEAGGVGTTGEVLVMGEVTSEGLAGVLERLRSVDCALLWLEDALA